MLSVLLLCAGVLHTTHLVLACEIITADITALWINTGTNEQNTWNERTQAGIHVYSPTSHVIVSTCLSSLTLACAKYVLYCMFTALCWVQWPITLLLQVQEVGCRSMTAIIHQNLQVLSQELPVLTNKSLAGTQHWLIFYFNLVVIFGFLLGTSGKFPVSQTGTLESAVFTFRITCYDYKCERIYTSH